MRAVLLGVALLAGSCGFIVPLECDDSEWEPNGLTCASVDSVMRPALGDIAGVTHLETAYDADCPSGGTCPPAWGTVTVTAHVSTGEPRQFLVSVGNDGFVDVEPVTGP